MRGMRTETLSVTAPPFSSFTEQTITAIGNGGEKLSEKPLVEEITHNIDSKLGSEVTEQGIPQILPNSESTTPSGHSTAIVDLHVQDTTTAASSE